MITNVFGLKFWIFTFFAFQFIFYQSQSLFHFCSQSVGYYSHDIWSVAFLAYSMETTASNRRCSFISAVMDPLQFCNVWNVRWEFPANTVNRSVLFVNDSFYYLNANTHTHTHQVMESHCVCGLYSKIANIDVHSSSPVIAITPTHTARGNNKLSTKICSQQLFGNNTLFSDRSAV